MKNLITIILLMFAFTATSQDITLLHINAKWNDRNDYNLQGLRNVKISKAWLEDQTAEFKSQVKAVPTIVLIGKDGKPKGQWTADLSFKLTVPKEEIQQRINFLLFEEK
tara:strand:+ start:1929 stop:2255 length:327 start_codon:yes stop_codon:yes gene_type:complete